MCGALEIPLGMSDPFAIAYNPINKYTYVLQAGGNTPQVVVLSYGREVARINGFPTGTWQELTSIGVNPISGLTYVTQWSADRVHFIEGTQLTGSYSIGYWGPAGVWPSQSTNGTYVSGKWFQSTSKSVYLTGKYVNGTVSVGDNADPNAGAVAESNEYLYLANSNADTVSIISAGSLVTTTGVGDHPNGVVYNPVNELVYVVNRGTSASQSTVSVIDGVAVTATIPLGPGYDEYLGVHYQNAITLQGNNYRGSTDIVTTDPGSGYVYVSNWGANTVSVITGTVLLTTLSVGLHPNSIAYNPVTGQVYVANTGDNTVTIIEGTSIVKTVAVGNYPIDLAVDTQSGLVYVVNRQSDSLSVIRCDDDLNEKRVLGHYLTWYKTPGVRGEWRMWNTCSHNPDTLDPQGFHDIAAVHYPLTGVYDSADPKAIENHLLMALAADIDGYVIDFYGNNDAGGIDEATRLVLQQAEKINAQYAKDFKIALMYDEGALIGQPAPVVKATSDFSYMLQTYASSPAYLWANGKPAMFYFPKGPILSPTDLAQVAQDFTLIYPDFPPDYLPVMDGSYAWVKAEPWESDGSNWGEPYLRWYYATFATLAPPLTFGVGGVWAGFDDVGVGEGWSCSGHRWIDRQGGQVYDWTWGILDDYNAGVGITTTVPISWVQLITLNDFMEGTELLPTVEDGYLYLQKTEDHARAFKGLPVDHDLDVYVPQHIYNARLASGTIANTLLITDAINTFYQGEFMAAMTLADQAAGIPAPINVTAVPLGYDSVTVSWQDAPGAVLATKHRVYYGITSGNYISSTLVSTASSVVLDGLEPNRTYYIAVTAVGAPNPDEIWYASESWYSKETAVKIHASYMPAIFR